MRDLRIISIFFLTSLIFFNCRNKQLDIECVNLTRTAHLFNLQTEVIPYKNVYKLGDTITFKFTTSDSIYDLSAEQKFLIRDFPFRPGSVFFKITSDSTYASGYRENQFIIEEKYDAIYQSPARYADFIRGNTIYEDGEYLFEYKIVLETTGKYAILHFDKHNENRLQGNQEDNAQARKIDFDGKCNEAEIWINLVHQENSNFENYIDCWEWIDENVYDGLIEAIDKDLRMRYDFLNKGGGNLLIDWSAPFAFEVVE